VAKAIKVYLVVEDPAHENIARALFRRLSFEEGIRFSIGPAVRGGHGGVILDYAARISVNQANHMI